MKSTLLRLAVICVFIGAAEGSSASVSLAEDQSSFVIMAYSRVGDDAYPESNLRGEQFEDHIKEIKSGNYNVVSLEQAINSVKHNQKLPPKSIVITFDGAFRSSYENAFPKLLDADMPFTIFYAADHSAPFKTAGQSQYLSAQELEKLAENENVSLGILPASYTHLSPLGPAEISALINKARKFHRDTFSEEARFFAYPFGEYNATIRDIVSGYNFEGAFGIHSGVVHAGTDLQFIPRFTITENYGSLERFRLVASALPLPATDIQPFPPAIRPGPLQLGFSVPKSLSKEIESLSCFISGQPEPQIEFIENRVELRSSDQFDEDGRLRVNCTMPGPAALGDTPRWRWLGMLLIHEDDRSLQTTDR